MIRQAGLQRFKRNVFEAESSVPGLNTINWGKLNSVLEENADSKILNQLYGDDYVKALTKARDITELQQRGYTAKTTDDKELGYARLIVFGYLSHKAAIIRGGTELDKIYKGRNLEKIFLDPDSLVAAARASAPWPAAKMMVMTVPGPAIGEAMEGEGKEGWSAKKATKAISEIAKGTGPEVRKKLAERIEPLDKYQMRKQLRDKTQPLTDPNLILPTDIGQTDLPYYINRAVRRITPDFMLDDNSE